MSPETKYRIQQKYKKLPRDEIVQSVENYKVLLHFHRRNIATHAIMKNCGWY